MKDVKPKEETSILPYNFKVSQYTDMNSFHFDNSIIIFKRSDERLGKVSFTHPISKVQKQQIGIRIIKTKDKFIYFGIEG